MPNNRGSILLFVLVFGSIALTLIISGVAGYAIFENRASIMKHNRDMAFQVAEAGISYYRWHLAHNPGDYQDGTGAPGPYVHEYKDKDGDLVGYYSLDIDQPLVGSSVVTIRSTGWVATQPQSKRTIQVRIGFPALTDYTFLSNANMNFSFTTEVHGTIHSNGGIRFDGTTDSWVKSAKDKYKYENQTHNGVWGGGGPKSFWVFPVPAIDFYAVTSDLSRIYTSASQAGIFLSSSGKEGWHLVFNNNQVSIYKVNTKDCYNGEGRWRNNKWKGWYWDGTTYCYDVGTETFVETRTIPANGAIFAEDNVWVEGIVDGRVSIGVGKFPVQEPYYRIIVNNNLLYKEKSSDDVIGLLSQGDIVVPYETPNNMEIDAAMLAQFSKIYRPYYDSNVKNSLTIFGSQISYAGGAWKYVNGWGHVISGYENTVHSYDANLRYFPPPGFPVGSVYDLISWEEL